jgi:hypothetical protein
MQRLDTKGRNPHSVSSFSGHCQGEPNRNFHKKPKQYTCI